jgi:hypothetical protein
VSPTDRVVINGFPLICVTVSIMASW